MNLYIAEKPSVGLEIAKALGAPMLRGEGYIQVGSTDLVSWCVGHLLSQASPEAYGPQYAQWDLATLPILPAAWQMEPNPKTKMQLSVVGKLLRRATCVINAGDAAREGQAIVDEVLDHFGYRGAAKRLWLREMNQPAIRKALGSMRDNLDYECLYASALARARADWLVGMNCTRGYTSAWQRRGNKGTLHIGRVQTPTLCLIVARDLDIEAFVPTPYFVLRATVTHARGTFTATWQPPANAAERNAEGRITARAPLDAIAQRVSGHAAQIRTYSTTPKTQGPPLPYSLGDLQKVANKRLGLSPSETLKIAQSLYETYKLTTYPRTDFSYLPSDEHALGGAIVAAARSNFAHAWPFEGTPDFTLKSAAWNSDKIGDHHAIRPTLVRDFDLTVLGKNELAIYQLVVAQFLAQFYPPHRYDSTIVEVDCYGERFRATGTVDVDPGWMIVLGTPAARSSDDAPQALPAMLEGDPCRITSTQIDTKRTSPPPRYDGASLIEAMEQAWRFVTDERVKATIRESGIGTPATRAAIVDHLIQRDYVEERREGKRKVYVATARGRLLYRAVPIQLRTPDLTAYFESLLSNIEAGTMTLPAFMDQQTAYVTKLMRDLQEGSVAAQMPSLAECEPPARPASPAKRGTKAAPAAASASAACPHCQRPLRTRKGRNGPFYGCSGYPTCSYTAPL